MVVTTVASDDPHVPLLRVAVAWQVQMRRATSRVNTQAELAGKGSGPTGLRQPRTAHDLHLR
ncbi:MAG: hypothetical protein ACYDAQ_09655 [Mycobacteriales bacterium]